MKIKKQVMTSIDSELHEKAKKKNLNISFELEKALRAKVNNSIEEDEIKTCKFCGARGEIQNVKNMDYPYNTIMWLCPDECWCCKRCFKEKGQLLALTIATSAIS